MLLTEQKVSSVANQRTDASRFILKLDRNTKNVLYFLIRQYSEKDKRADWFKIVLL